MTLKFDLLTSVARQTAQILLRRDIGVNTVYRRRVIGRANRGGKRERGSGGVKASRIDYYWRQRG